MLCIKKSSICVRVALTRENCIPLEGRKEAAWWSWVHLKPELCICFSKLCDTLGRRGVYFSLCFCGVSQRGEAKETEEWWLMPWGWLEAICWNTQSTAFSVHLISSFQFAEGRNVTWKTKLSAPITLRKRWGPCLILGKGLKSKNKD